MYYFKRVLIAVTIFFIIAAITLSTLITKEDVTQVLSQVTNKQVAFDNYTVTFFPALALRLHNIELTDDNIGNAKVKELIVKIDFAMLLNPTNINVNEIEVIEPTIHIKKQKNTPARNITANLPSVKHIRVQNATLIYEHNTIKNLSLLLSINDSKIAIKEFLIPEIQSLKNISLQGHLELKENHLPYVNVTVKSDNNAIQELAHNFGFEIAQSKDKKFYEYFSFEVALEGNQKELALKKANFMLDEMTIQAKGVLKNQDTINSTIHINQLDFDKYTLFKTAKDELEDAPYPKFLKNLNLKSDIRIDKLLFNEKSITKLNLNLHMHKEMVTINPITFELYQGHSQGKLSINMKSSKPKVNFENSIENLNLGELFYKENLFEGKINIKANGNFLGFNYKEIINTLQGSKQVTSKNLILKQYDLDELLKSYEKTKNVSLFDIGAMFAAGPFAGLFTQSNKFLQLKQKLDNKGQTEIKVLNSTWIVKEAQVKAQDVAIRTKDNLIAVKGAIDLDKLTYNNMEVAILNENMCVKYKESLSGNLEKSEVNVNKNYLVAFLAPITSILKETGKVLTTCKPYYTGVVKW